jgi:hypothetical protein
MTNETEKKVAENLHEKKNASQLKSQNQISSLEKGGVNYILKEVKYLIISGVIPLFTLIFNIPNFIHLLALNDPDRNPQQPPPQPNSTPSPPPVFDVLTPLIIMIVFSMVALIKFGFLLRWRQKFQSFRKISRLIQPKKEDPVSMTALFYDLVNHMENIRKVFILLNLIFLLYLQFFIRYIMGPIFKPVPGQPPRDPILEVLNFVSQIALIFYMVFEWTHFLRWNKKLTKLTKLEQQIYEEIGEIGGNE